jgi:hypothetical protein
MLSPPFKIMSEPGNSDKREGPASSAVAPIAIVGEGWGWVRNARLRTLKYTLLRDFQATAD